MSNYPTKIDTDLELPLVIDGVTENASSLINGIREAVVAIETALGINPQGSENDLSTRVANALNSDGTIKSSALPSTLVDLPLSNSQIGASAGIVESKLDLDVGTQVLQNQVSSNDVDIANLQQSLAALLTRYGLHIGGISDRHDSDHINHILADGYSFGIGTNVETALDYLFGRLNAHRDAQVIREHYASAVEYTPSAVVEGIPNFITSTNVQGAIDDVEIAIIEEIRQHNDLAHSDGVGNDGYLLFGGQAAVNDASLKLTRYQPNSGTDIVKIGLCNAATIKTKGFSPTEFSSLSNAFDITIDIGGKSRTINITGLDGSEYPVGDGRVTLLGVVDYLNAAFADTSTPAHFPVSAFASDDGELVLQLNVTRDDATITVTSPGANSAIDALGLTDIAGQAVSVFQNYEFVINGTRFTELKTLANTVGTQLSLSTTVDLGITIDSSGIDLKANDLIHIYDHDVTSSIGTYRVSSLASSTEVQLSENLVAGDFSFVIYRDSFDTNAITSDRRVLDFYLDANREPILSERGTVVFGGVEGVRILEVSQNFVAFSGSFTLETIGAKRALKLTDGDGYHGTSTFFDTGYIGYLQIASPANDSFVTGFVFDVAPVNGTDAITIIDSEIQDDRLLLGTSHHDGLSGIEIPLSRRNVGLVGNSAIGSEFKKSVIETDINNLHTSGFIRGFDIITSNSTQIIIRGGVAYISGKRLEFPTKTISALNVAKSDGTWNVVLNADGNIDLFKEGDGSTSTEYSVADILYHDSLLMVAQIVVSGGAISSYVDARFFINDLETRIQLTVDDRELGSGSFRTLEAASLYSKSAPNDTKPEITILSDLTFANALVIDSGARIIAFGDLTLNGNLTLSSNSSLKCYGSLTVAGTITLSSSSTLEILGGGDIAEATLGDDSRLMLDGYLTSDTITSSGDRVFISGSGATFNSTVLFDDTGLSITGSNTVVENLKLTSQGLNTCVSIVGASDCILHNLDVQQGTLTLAQLSQTARTGISITGTSTGIFVSNSSISELGRGIYISGTVSDITVSDCIFTNIGSPISAIGTSRISIIDNTFKNLDITGISLSSTVGEGIIRGNLFKDTYDVTSTPIGISTQADRTVVEGNIFDTIDGTVLYGSSSSGSESSIFSNNLIKDCVTSSFAITLAGVSSSIVSGNVFENHDGALVSEAGSNQINSNHFETTESGNTFTIGASTFNDNYISVTGAGTILTDGSNVVGNNFISIGSAVFKNSEVHGNYLISTQSTGTVFTFSADAGNHVASGNMISTSGVTSGAYLSNVNSGKLTFSSNHVTGSTPLNAIQVRSSGASSYTNVNDNSVENGANYGILINGSNVSVQGNVTYGAVSNGDISGGTSYTNMVISNNFVNGTGGDSRGVYHQDANPTGVFIFGNKNALEQKAFSVYGATAIDNWDFTLSGVKNMVATNSVQKLLIPMHFDTGPELESINIQISNSSSAGAATVTVYRRDTSATASTAISTVTSAANTAAGTFASLNVPITSTEYVRNGYEYFTVVNIPASLADNTIIVGQVIANLRI